MERLCLVDFDDTLILTDSLKSVFLGERWFLSPGLLVVGIRLFFCRLFRKGEFEARSEFKRRLLLKYSGLSDEVRKAYIQLFKDKVNHVLTDRIIEGQFDRVVIISASEEELIKSVIGDSIAEYDVIANRIPAYFNDSKVKTAERTGLSVSEDQHSEEFRTCYGAEKVRRLLDLFPNCSDYGIIIYTDSFSDQPLIEIADEAYLVKGAQITHIKAGAQQQTNRPEQL